MWYAVSVKPLEMGGRGVRILEMIEVTSRKRWPVRISAEWDGGPEKPSGVKAGAEASPVHSVWPVLAVRWHLIRPRSSPLPSRRCYHPVIRLREWDAVINLILFHAHSGWSKTKLDKVVPTLPFSRHDKYLTYSASGIWGARGVAHRGTRSPISRFFSAPCSFGFSQAGAFDSLCSGEISAIQPPWKFSRWVISKWSSNPDWN